MVVIPPERADGRCYREAGVTHVGRIPNGARPADLQQSTKFSLTIKLRAAKALGLMVFRILPVAATEVIEQV